MSALSREFRQPVEPRHLSIELAAEANRMSQLVLAHHRCCGINPDKLFKFHLGFRFLLLQVVFALIDIFQVGFLGPFLIFENGLEEHLVAFELDFRLNYLCVQVHGVLMGPKNLKLFLA